MMLIERLRERVSDWSGIDSAVDRAERVVRNVALAGTESRNGYRYSEEALRGAVPLYEGRPVFLDHAANSQRPHERSTRDLVGSIRQVRFEAGRVRGDIEVLETESGRTFLALAESNTDSVGMSHVVLAVRSADKQIVERIEEVISVDAVVFPATTVTFREQMQGAGMDSINGSFEALLARMDEALAELEEAPERVATFEGYVVTAANDGNYDVRSWNETETGMDVSESLGVISAEELSDGSWCERIDQGQEAQPPATEERWRRCGQGKNCQRRLQERYQRLLKKYVSLNHSRRRSQQVENLLREARLPAEAVTSEFREMLNEADEKQRRLLLEDRKKMWRVLEQRQPQSLRRGTGEFRDNDDAFIRGVRGR